MPMPLPSMPVAGSNSTAAQSKSGAASQQATNPATAANPFEKMTISSKTFVPQNIKSSDQPIQGDGAARDGSGQGQNRGHANSVDPFEDFGGYSNPYSATIDIEKEKRKQQELEE